MRVSISHFGNKILLYTAFVTYLFALSACDKNDEKYLIETSGRLVVIDNLKTSKDMTFADIHYYWADPVLINGNLTVSAIITEVYKCNSSESSYVKGTATTKDGRKITKSLESYIFKRDNSINIQVVCDKDVAKKKICIGEYGSNN